MQHHVAPLGCSRLWLFGSRADPEKRGGDIDLYLEVDAYVPDVLALVRDLRLALFSQIGEQRIDIIVRAENTSPSALHELAKLEGVLLWQHPKTCADTT
jgi:predicted nucleotidyltransferase